MINKRRSHLRKMYDLRNEFKYALADIFFKGTSVFVENIRSGKITDYLQFLWTELVKSEHLSPETYSTDFNVNLRFVKENEELFLFFAMPDIIDANKPNFDYYKWHSSIGVGYMLYFNFKRNICRYYVCESSLKSSFDAFRLGLYKGDTYYVPMYFVIEFVNGERRSLGTISSPSIEEVNSRFCNAVACDVGSIVNTEHSELWKAIINKAPFEEIKKMIEAGANLNEIGTNEDYIDDYDLHELFYTCYVHPDCFELVKLFIENGYDYKKIARNGLNAVSNYAEYPDSRVFFYLYSLDQNLMFNPIGNGNSMLHNCLSSGSFEVLKFLEEKGADLKANYEVPLLAAAVFNEDIRILKYLIEEKKLPYKDNNIFDNKNLLMLAAANANSPDTIKYIVSLGFDVNSLTPNGNPIIFETALNPNPEITETFLELGADLNKTNNYGYNIFPYAVMHNENPEYIKYLINKGLSVKQTFKNEWTITHYAVANPNPQILQTLLEYGAPYDKLNIRELKPFKPLDYSIINDSDELKYLSPLALAAKDRTPEVCEILIKAGARLEARDKYGRTPLMMATENPNPDVFRLLLKNGADIKALDYMNQGVLNRALAFSCVELVNEIAEITNAQFTDYNYYSYIKRKAKAQALRMLVEEKPDLLKDYQLIGIDPYLPKENKLPYIFLAARNPDLRVLEYLEKKGCDISLGTAEENVFTYALANNPNPNIIDYLINKKLFINDNLFISEYIAKNPYVDVWKKLFEMGFPQNYQDENGISLLMLVFYKNDKPNLNVVHLLSNESIVNLKDKNGMTVAHLAAQNIDLNYLRILQAAGADLDIQEKAYGYTPLMMACYKNVNPEVIKYLIISGASIKEKAYDGKTLAHFAASNPNPQVMQTIIDYGVIFDREDKVNNQTPLQIAAWKGTPEVCKILLDKGSRLEARDKDNCTPLINSTNNPNPEVFRFLLKSGANIKAKDCLKCTVVHHSIANSCLELVKEIIEITKTKIDDSNFEKYMEHINKFNIIQKMFENKGLPVPKNRPVEKLPFLLYAAYNPDIDVLDYFANKEINVFLGNFTENIFAKALSMNPNPNMINYLYRDKIPSEAYEMVACNLAKSPYIDVWKRVFELGLPIDFQDRHGNSLLMILFLLNEFPNPEIVKLLANEKTVKLKNNDGLTICHYAASKENLIYLEILKKAGALLNEKDNVECATPLMFACSKNPNPKVIDFLINNGAKITDTNFNGNNSLFYSIFNSNPQIALHLIKDYKADLHAKDRNGANLLMEAIKSNSVDLIKLFIELGIDINEKDNRGYSAVIYSAFYNPNPQVIDLLVQKGADINYLTDRKENVLIFAARNNPNEEVIEYLLNKGFDKNYITADGETPILAAAQNFNCNIMKKLKEKGANFEAVDKEKRNVLFIASKCNDNPSMISFIIENGIPVNYRDQFGNTAVLFAAQNNNINIIKTLVEKGADLKSENDRGFTALMSALYEGNNNIEMIKYLIENGIDVNAKSSENITALMEAAAAITDPEIIELLITAGADILEEDFEGNNAYKIAKEYNPNPAVAEIIKKYSLMSQTNDSKFNIPTNIN